MRYAIYDDGGKSIDRYTLRILTTPKEFTTDSETTKYLLRKYGKYFNEMFGFNANPFHPQGFGQYCGEYKTSRSYKHLGKLITIDQLPDQARKYVNQILKEYKNNT
jgi:hypothetical protein